MWPSATRRKPPHESKIDARLIDGMVSFRNSTAATYEATSAETFARNQKERAKIHTRILTLDTGSAPPSRGGLFPSSVPAIYLGQVSLRVEEGAATGVDESKGTDLEPTSMSFFVPAI